MIERCITHGTLGCNCSKTDNTAIRCPHGGAMEAPPCPKRPNNAGGAHNHVASLDARPLTYGGKVISSRGAYNYHNRILKPPLGAGGWGGGRSCASALNNFCRLSAVVITYAFLLTSTNEVAPTSRHNRFRGRLLASVADRCRTESAFCDSTQEFGTLNDLLVKHGG